METHKLPPPTDTKMDPSIFATDSKYIVYLIWEVVQREKKKIVVRIVTIVDVVVVSVNCYA